MDLLNRDTKIIQEPKLVSDLEEADLDPELRAAIEMSQTIEPVQEKKEPPPQPERPKNRCGFVKYNEDGTVVTECKERLTLATQLTGKCRCGPSYCSKHKISHGCTFDYQQMTKEKLTKDNPKIIGNRFNLS